MREDQTAEQQVTRGQAPAHPAAEAPPVAAPATGNAALARYVERLGRSAEASHPPPAAVPALLASGNAVVSRLVAGLAREPAAAADVAPGEAAQRRALDAARAASRGPVLDMVRALTALGADRGRLEPVLAADAQVDARRLALAGRVLAVKDAPSTDAYVALGRDLAAGGIPLAERDEIYEHLGIGGLAAPSQITAFAADLKGAMGWLAQNKGFEARAAKLVGLVDGHLAAVGVPRLLGAAQGGAHEYGKFDRATWSILITPALGELDVAAEAGKATAILTTFFHEARHAEQDFQLLRLLAAEHPDELDGMDVPDDVLVSAQMAGPPAGAQRALAESVRDAASGPAATAFAERRDKLRGEYADLEARGASKEELDAKYQERWRNYAGQAHEADAFQAEKRLQSELGAR